MPTWSCPTPPISNATTASACSTGRSREPDDAGRRDPLAGGGARAPRPRRGAPVPVGAGRSRPDRLGLPGFVDRRRPASATRDYADYIIRHERRPGVGPLMGLSRRRKPDRAAARPTPTRSTRYIANGGFFTAEVPAEAALLQALERAPIRTGRWPWAFTTSRSPISSSSIPSRCAASSLPPKATATASRPTICAPGSAPTMDPAADLVSALRRRGRGAGYPAARPDPAADGDVPLLGLAERLAPPDPRA